MRSIVKRKVGKYKPLAFVNTRRITPPDPPFSSVKLLRKIEGRNYDICAVVVRHVDCDDEIRNDPQKLYDAVKHEIFSLVEAPKQPPSDHPDVDARNRLFVEMSVRSEDFQKLFVQGGKLFKPAFTGKGTEIDISVAKYLLRLIQEITAVPVVYASEIAGCLSKSVGGFSPGCMNCPSDEKGWTSPVGARVSHGVTFDDLKRLGVCDDCQTAFAEEIDGVWRRCDTKGCDNLLEDCLIMEPDDYNDAMGCCETEDGKHLCASCFEAYENRSESEEASESESEYEDSFIDDESEIEEFSSESE